MMTLWILGVILFFLADRLSKVTILITRSNENFLFHEPFAFTGWTPTTLVGVIGVFFLCIESLIFFQYIQKKETYIFSPYFIFFHSLLTAGALSNIIDRIFYGAVLDIFQIPYFVYFNCADAFILSGGMGIGYWIFRRG